MALVGRQVVQLVRIGGEIVELLGRTGLEKDIALVILESPFGLFIPELLAGREFRGSLDTEELAFGKGVANVGPVFPAHEPFVGLVDMPVVLGVDEVADRGLGVTRTALKLTPCTRRSFFAAANSRIVAAMSMELTRESVTPGLMCPGQTMMKGVLMPSS